MTDYDTTLLTRIGWALTVIAIFLLLILVILAVHVVRHWDDAYEDEGGDPPYDTGSPPSSLRGDLG